MRHGLFAILLSFAAALAAPIFSLAQQSTPTAATSLPRLMRYGGVFTNAEGTPRTGVVGVMFSLYSEQQGGTALWTELQNVTLDANGQYSVLLGSQHTEGVPADLFTTNEARWLGIQVEAEPEQARILLVSVPYALKAGDAETLGGRPLSAFLLNPNADASGGATTSNATAPSPTTQAAASGVQTFSVNTSGSGGTANYVAKWIDASTLGNSLIYDSGGKVGIGTTSPGFTLDVVGGIEAVSTAFPQINFKQTGGGGVGAVTQEYRYQIDPDGSYRIYDMTSGVIPRFVLTKSGQIGIGTTSPTYNMDVVVGAQVQSTQYPQFNFKQTGGGGALAQEWRFQINPDGSYHIYDITGGVASRLVILQNGNIGISNDAPGQRLTVGGAIESTSGGFKFPDGSKQITAALPLAGGTLTGNLALPATGPTFWGVGLPLTGVLTLGGQSFLHSYGDASNTFVGPQAGGQFAITVNPKCGGDCPGLYNTATGYKSLYALTTGLENSAFGALSLTQNTTGQRNSAFGYQSLAGNTEGWRNSAFGLKTLDANKTGNNNTAIGFAALISGNGDNNTAIGAYAGEDDTGSNNTFVGYQAGPPLLSNTALTNATAIGSNAVVNQSNALVLGAPGTNVGIGTATPIATLQLNENDAANADRFLIGNDSIKGLALFDTGTGVDIQSYGVPLHINYAGNNFTLLNTLASSSGYVGIGTATPDNMLTVNGSADKPGGGSWGTYSDARLKTVGGNFQPGLAEVLNLNPVYYRYKEKNALGITDRDQHVGLVAKEVEKILPEAVSMNNQGYRLVNNDPILWAMVNAIKQQQAVIQKQAEEIKAQQEQITRLASQTRAIQAALANKRTTLLQQVEATPSRR